MASTMTEQKPVLVTLSTGLIGGLIDATLSPIVKALTQLAGLLTHR